MVKVKMVDFCKSKAGKITGGVLVIIIVISIIIGVSVGSVKKGSNNNAEFKNAFNNNIALQGDNDTSSTQYKFWSGSKTSPTAKDKLQFTPLSGPVLGQYYRDSGYGKISLIKEYLGNTYADKLFTLNNFIMKKDGVTATFTGKIYLIYCSGYNPTSKETPPVFGIAYQEGTATIKVDGKEDETQQVKLIALADAKTIKTYDNNYKFKMAQSPSYLTPTDPTKNPITDTKTAYKMVYDKFNSNKNNTILTLHYMVDEKDSGAVAAGLKDMKISDIKFHLAKFIVTIPFTSKPKDGVKTSITFSFDSITDGASLLSKFNTVFLSDFMWKEEGAEASTTLLKNPTSMDVRGIGTLNRWMWNKKITVPAGYTHIKYLSGHIYVNKISGPGRFFKLAFHKPITDKYKTQFENNIAIYNYTTDNSVNTNPVIVKITYDPKKHTLEAIFSLSNGKFYTGFPVGNNFDISITPIFSKV